MKKVLLFTALLMLLHCFAYAECKTCGIGRREKEAKNTVKYPPPPVVHHTRVPEEKLYKKIPIRRPQTATSVASYPVTVYPERTVWLMLSNTDVNRIVCTQGDITYVFTSQEKGVVTQIKEDELYIKFKSLLDPATGKLKRVKTPTELYVRCAGETYSFIAKPRQIPSRTIYLESGKKKVTPPEDITKKSSVTSAMVEVIRSVFLQKIPSSWEKPKKRKDFVNVTKFFSSAKVKISEKQRWRIPGVPIIVRAFSISSSKRVQVGEKILLDPSITKNPVAISIMDHIIAPIQPTMAVIVERLWQ